MRVGYDGAQSDLDRKRIDHDTTARGDKPLDRGPDVLDEQIDSRPCRSVCSTSSASVSGRRSPT